MNEADPPSGISGDHIEFHGNLIEKAVGVEHHHHYPPEPSRSSDQIVEGEIPQKPPGFQPRGELLHRLAALLGGPSTLLGESQSRNGQEASTGGAVAICAMAGIPGVGKTMLAASYAWACQDARWPVIAWIPAETTDQIVTGLASLASRLGERRPDDDTPTAAARAKAWLAATTRPALLVFDNATDVAAVRSWTPATGATRVIITTRHGAFLRAYQPLEVEVFTPEQAIAFLRERTGLTDTEGAKAVASELGHLPLALAQAAAVISRLRIDYAAYLEQLRSVRLSENLTAESGDVYPTSTAEAILLSVTHAEATLPIASRILPILAVLSPAGVPLAMLNTLSDDANPQFVVRSMLADLADTSLITVSEDGTTALMHRLVQRVLRERAAHHNELLSVIAQASALLDAFDNTLPDGPQLWKYRTDVEMLVEQTDTLYQHLPNDDALTEDLLRLRARCGRYLYELADLRRAILLLESTLTDAERILGPDHPDTLTSRNNLAGAYESAGDLNRAIPLHERTLADHERILGPDHPNTLTSRNNLAGAYQAAGDLNRAIPLHERTLADAERILGPDHLNTQAIRNILAAARARASRCGWRRLLARRRSR